MKSFFVSFFLKIQSVSGETLNNATKTNWDNAVPEWWDKSIMVDMDRKSLFSKLRGRERSGAPMIEKEDLSKNQGDQINFNVLSRLVGKGVTASNTLSGNEEKIVPNKFSVTVDQYRHATAANHLADLTAIIDFVPTARTLIGEWGTRKLDDLVLDQVLNTDTLKTLFAGSKTSRGNLAPGDAFLPAEMNKLRIAAERRGVIPFSMTKSGTLEVPVFGACLSEWDYYQMIEDPDFKEDARHALLRGGKNPAITAAMGMYKGIMLYIFTSVNVGDGVTGSFLRPEAVLTQSHSAAVTTITAGKPDGTSVANVDYWQYFPQSGTNRLLIGNEQIEYTATPGDTTITGVDRGAGGTAGVTHAAGDLVTLNNLGKILVFGKEFVMRAWSERPNKISQEEDYGEEKGLGIRFTAGHKGVENSDGVLGRCIVMEAYSPNPGTI